MRISKTLMTGAVAAVAVAGTASASTVIDNFTNAASPSASSLGPYGSGYNGLGTFSNTGQTGSGIVGSRLLYDNARDGGTVASTMSGNGQWRAVVTSGPPASFSDTQLISQYRFGSVLDFSQGFSITGSGSASGGGTYTYNEEILDDKGIPIGTQPAVGTVVGYGIGIQLMMGANSSGGSTGRMWCNIDMYGSRSLGNFTFTAADFAAALAANQFVGVIDLTQVNAIGVVQYAYSGFTAQEMSDYFGSTGGGAIAGGSWDYTATSFSVVPAPGALALLGVAGLVGTRRRR